MNKSEIRKKILKIRKNEIYKNRRIKFKSIIKILKREKIYGKIIGGYYPFNYEVNIMEILDNFEKKKYSIALPKIKKNNQMDFFEWSINDPLKINKYGIVEPISSKKVYPDLIFVPLVAYDNNLNRLGYGGGFYDRYIDKINKLKKVIKIGVSFSFQKLKKIPVNDHDKKLDFIITEKKII